MRTGRRLPASLSSSSTPCNTLGSLVALPHPHPPPPPTRHPTPADFMSLLEEGFILPCDEKLWGQLKG